MSRLFLAVALSVLTILIATPQSYATSAADYRCAEQYEAVFARGSGDSGIIRADAPTNAFKDAFEAQFSDRPEAYNIYNLGTESYNNSLYPHVSIKGLYDSGYINGAGALLSNGEGYEYGKSVDTGVHELTGYLTERMAKCPDKQYILGGFSQGAHVVSETLFALTTNQLNKISYIALFGDPKLYLPEAAQYTIGEKISKERKANDPYYNDEFGYPSDACYGAGLSKWRHTVDNCNTHTGSLYIPRSDYYPKEVSGKIHTWCFAEDGVCDSNTPVWGGGHSRYAETRGVPTAVAEAVNRDVTYDFSSYDAISDIKGQNIDFVIIPSWPCYVGLDYKYRYLDPLFSIIKSEDYISGRIRYVGAGNAYESSDYSYQGVKEALKTLYITYYPASPRRSDALLVYIIYTDKFCAPWSSLPLHSALPYDTLSLRTSYAANSTDDSGIPYVITLPDDTTTLANNQNAVPFATTSITPLNLSQLVSQATVPTTLSLHNFQATPNEPVRFSLSSVPSGIKTISWDFNSDGVFDEVSTASTTTHTYSEPFSGGVTVRTVTTGGRIGQDSAKVTVAAQYTSHSLPPAPLGVKVQRLAGDSAKVSWAKVKNDNSTTRWNIRVDGYPVGKTTLETTEVTISDMHFETNKFKTISVEGINTDGSAGPPASAAIGPEQTESDPSLNRTGADVGNLIAAIKSDNPIPAATQPVQNRSNPEEEISAEPTNSTQSSSLTESVTPAYAAKSGTAPNQWGLKLGIVVFSTLSLGVCAAVINRHHRR